MKFADVVKGRLARRGVELPLDGAEWDVASGAWKGGTTVPLDVRVLSPDEWARVLSGARAFALEMGVAEDAVEQSELYDYGQKLHAVALACTDRESPEDAPAPFFSGVEEIRASRRLTPEIVAYLFAEWDAWQGRCNPRGKNLSETEWWSTTLGVAGKDEEQSFRFFIRLSPGTQWRYVRSLAARLIESLSASSTSGAGSTSTEAPGSPGTPGETAAGASDDLTH